MSNPENPDASGKVGNGRIFLTRKDFDDFKAEILEGQRSVEKLLKGDEDLKVPPVRDLIAFNNSRIDNIERLVDRLKWFFIGFGVLNGAQLITWIVAVAENAKLTP